MTELILIPRSKLEEIKLKKIRLKYKKEIDKTLRKWTIIYTSFIFIWSFLFILLILIGWWPTSLVLISGLFIFSMDLVDTRDKCRELYKKVKKLKELDDRIVKIMKETENLKAKYE